jgi:hypothetical protein
LPAREARWPQRIIEATGERAGRALGGQAQAMVTDMQRRLDRYVGSL